MEKINTNNTCGFVVFQSNKDNQFYFHLKAGNGEIILQSEGYKQKAGCENGISSVKENAPKSEQYDRRIAQNDEPYFVLKARNGEIIGLSETYDSNQGMENSIRSVMENAPDAEVCYAGGGRDTIIIVAGEQKVWNDKNISFQQVIELAFGTYVENGRTCYTVSFSRGPRMNPQGTMVKGDVVKVKHKMVFNVTATDKS